MNLRKFAQGQSCTLRLIDDNGIRICNGNNDSVVLCHIRMGGVAGTGQKPNDLIGVHACSACHDRLDGRRTDDVSSLDRDILRALCQTLDRVGKKIEKNN